MVNIDGRLSSVLDISRASAAVLVLLSHLNGRVFLTFAKMPEIYRGPVFKAWTFICGFGHQAVIVFFVMSGFLVGGSLLRTGTSIPALKNYAASRIARMWSVLLPALILTFILDMVGIRLDSTYEPIYHGDWINDLSGFAAGCNLFFMQTVTCSAYGSNGPLWSLANEGWYYLLFPLTVILFEHKSKRQTVGLLGLVLLGFIFVYQNSHSIAIYYSIWLFGVAISRIRCPFSPWIAWGGVGLYLISTRILFRFSVWLDPVYGLILDIFLGLLFALALASSTGVSQPILGHKFFRWLADRSFSLYAIHLPIIMFLCALLGKYASFKFGSLPLLSQWMWCGLIFIIVILAANIFHVLFESRHIAFKKLLLKPAYLG